MNPICEIRTYNDAGRVEVAVRASCWSEAERTQALRSWIGYDARNARSLGAWPSARSEETAGLLADLEVGGAGAGGRVLEVSQYELTRK